MYGGDVFWVMLSSFTAVPTPQSGADPVHFSYVVQPILTLPERCHTHSLPCHYTAHGYVSWVLNIYVKCFYYSKKSQASSTDGRSENHLLNACGLDPYYLKITTHSQNIGKTT